MYKGQVINPAGRVMEPGIVKHIVRVHRHKNGTEIMTAKYVAGTDSKNAQPVRGPGSGEILNLIN
jgi:hypothetical protein